jgi:molybdopterin molybdotransferase
VLEQILAGTIPTQPLFAGCASRIMTGAPIPRGADAVVRREDAQFDESAGIVELSGGAVAPGTNILRRAATLAAGQRVVAAGRLLRPQEIGALAEIGKHRLRVRPRPRVGVLATGDELVPIDQRPGAGQIRNSNETMLAAQVRRAGGVPRSLGIARDDRAELRDRILAGRDCDVLLLSGGVSEGTHDLVPAELAAAGVRPVFHKIHLRPGKPLWFGVWSRTEGGPEGAATAVFGLPGNPVSSLVCFELFVRPCLRRLMGLEPARLQPIRARLARDHVARGERPTYNPARVAWEESGPTVLTLPWQGSSDLQATIDADAMAVFPAGDRTYARGDAVDVIVWDRPGTI